MTRISSAQNQHVKAVIKLRESRQRRRKHQFLIDGWKEISRAARNGIEIQQLFVCSEQQQSSPNWGADQSNSDGERASSLEQLVEAVVIEADRIHSSEPAVFDLPLTLFAKVVYGARTGEAVAVARTPDKLLADIPVDANSLIAVIEAVEKPGNVGAVIRSACGAGCSGVIVSDPGTDLFNPNTVRSSLGSLFTIPVCACSGEEAVRWLAEHQFQIVTARVDANQSYLEIDYRRPTAIVLGSEAAGLSPIWNSASMTPVQIPMTGGIDSLNISVSAAILFYEAMRQRSVG